MQIRSLKGASLYNNMSKRDAHSATALIDLGARLIHLKHYRLWRWLLVVLVLLAQGLTAKH